MSRVKAAAIHFVISVIVFSLFVCLVYFVWYAYPYYLLEGVSEIVLLMAGVDVVLGPLLTLALFKIGKPGLKMDLFLIAVVQIAALIYGSYIIYSERPLFGVFYKDYFEVVDRSDVDQGKLPSGIRKVGFFDKPQLVYQPPVDGSEFEQLKQNLRADRSPRYVTYYENYKDYSSNKQHVLKGSEPAADLYELKELLNIAKLNYTYFKGSKQSIIVLLDNRTAEIKSYFAR